jgi:hypothetical protein
MEPTPRTPAPHRTLSRCSFGRCGEIAGDVPYGVLRDPPATRGESGPVLVS